MEITVTDQDVYEALTHTCANGPDGTNEHSYSSTCENCINGMTLTTRGRELADLMAKYIRQAAS